MNDQDLQILDGLARDWLRARSSGNNQEAWRVGESIRTLPGPWQEPWVAIMPDGATLMTPGRFLAAIAGAIQEGASASAALDQVCALLSTSSASGGYLLGMIGPNVKGDIQVSDDLLVIPGDQFPQQHSVMADHVGPHHRVSCCVRYPLKVSPPFEKGDDLLRRMPKANLSMHEKMRDLAGVIALFSKSPVSLVGIAFDYDSQAMRNLCGSGAGLHLAPGQLMRGWAGSPIDCDLTSLPDAWKGWQGLAAGSQRVIRTASDRINRSRLLQRSRPGDACIEACIALEAMFGAPPSDSITYKISTRCARFLESSIEARSDTRKFLVSAYAKRSKGVHGDAAEFLPGDHLDRLCDMAARAAQIFLLKGMPSPEAMDFG